VAIQKMTDRIRLAAVVAALLLTAAPAGSAAEAPATQQLAGARPNIVLIMPDDMGYADMACHGNPLIQTPHLDRLYQESVRFTDFHVSPTCAPTRAALMTGRHEFKSGVTHTLDERERLAPRAVTLAESLRRAGYATGIFGKWHLGDEEPYQPTQRGFDEAFIHGAGGIGQSFPGSCGDAPGNKYFDPLVRYNGRFVRTKGYCTDVFFAKAFQWIDEVRSDSQPFFAYITPNAPHAPLISPGQRYDDLYAGKAIDGTTLSEDDVAYYAMITNIDENVGKLLQGLSDLGLERNTLVIFLSDNGGTHTHLYDGGFRGGKSSVYHGGTHAPSFWRWTGTLPAGVDCAALTAHLDVFPTLAALAGASLSPEELKQVEGRSLLPLLAKPQSAWPDRLLVSHLGRWPRGMAQAKHKENYSIRNRRFRLVNDRELYDLPADPGEEHNVLHEHPSIVAELRREYDKWWNDVTPLLVNEAAAVPEANAYRTLYDEQVARSGVDKLDLDVKQWPSAALP
jgi:arylsulfatase